uniref:Uncharacterized protein n=1 Tax=Arundo donax TaxID=35708 RepID=A0A0A9D442_ARUDO
MIIDFALFAAALSKDFVKLRLQLLVNTSILFKSLVMLSPSFSMCFLGRSERSRILCFLAVAQPKRIADSWNLFNWFNMAVR